MARHKHIHAQGKIPTVVGLGLILGYPAQKLLLVKCSISARPFGRVMLFLIREYDSMRRHPSPELEEVDTKILDWNVIVTVRPHHFRAAYELLEGLGEVATTAYHNVLALKVADVGDFLETLHNWMETYPDTRETIAHVGPCVETFTFDSPEEFETKLKEAAIQFEPEMAGRRFHVRMHRRGWKGRLETPHEERLLGECLHEMLKANPHSRIDFEDPDVILAVEVLDHRAGVALWTRANRTRYPFLYID